MAYVPTALRQSDYDTNGQIVSFPGHDYFNITSFNAADWVYSFQNNVIPMQKSSNVDTAGAAALTLSFAQMSFGIVCASPTQAQVMTTDTAANIIAGFNWIAVDDTLEKESWELTVINKSAFALTVAGGANVVFFGTPILANESAMYSVTLLTASTVEMIRLA
tara:strand:+ start:405 stop:893 length:489 start_codon:yes stop_codon:yes gene_type:complete